jgi:uncharacterized protein YuzE
MGVDAGGNTLMPHKDRARVIAEQLKEAWLEGPAAGYTVAGWVDYATGVIVAALAVPPVPTAGCEEVQVKESICYLRFGVPSGKRKTIDLGRSVRDEMLIADLDEFGRVIGIELVGGVDKPCQSLPSPPQEQK